MFDAWARVQYVLIPLRLRRLIMRETYADNAAKRSDSYPKRSAAASCIKLIRYPILPA